MSYHQRQRTHEKITAYMRLIVPRIVRQRESLAAFRYQEAPPPPSPLPQADDTWPMIERHSYWGRWNTHFYLQTIFSMPSNWSTDAAIALDLPIGKADDFFNAHPEALVYVDDVLIGTVDTRHQQVMLPQNMRNHQQHTLTLVGWTGIGGSYWGEEHTQLFMGDCALVEIDPPTRKLVATLRTAWEVAQTLDENSPALGYLWDGLTEAVNTLDTRQPLDRRFYNSVPEAQAKLDAQISRAGEPMPVQIYAAGHAHIDVAWMWPLSVTRGKAARTFTTALQLMEQFPEYQFSQSQPQLYEFIQQDDPALFERIRERVDMGNWEPLGGMWIEADCNMSSGESLVRQFVYGRRYFQQQFGTDSPVLWLPDAFGFPWSLPQIIKGAGIDYFFTIKIGWSQFAQLPHDSFWWQGIDGTKILTHCSPTPEPYPRSERATYNAVASGEYALRTWYQTKNKDLDNHLLMSYGWGDGGGGPTPDMLENIRELENFPAVPKVKPSRVFDFFKILEHEVSDRLPTWHDELYLQYHQGTYTSQAAVKAGNRHSEMLLHNTEFFAAYAATLQSDYRYPYDQLEHLWKRVLLNQFHDILPGSSVSPVYDDALHHYDEVERGAYQLMDVALAVLSERLGGDVVVLNPSPVPQHRVMWIGGTLPDDTYLVNTKGQVVYTQRTDDGILLFTPEDIPPYNAVAFKLQSGDPITSTQMPTASPYHLQSPFIRVEFDDNGDITRIYDKQNDWNILAPDTIGNQFQMFEDNPKDFDAWNIDVSYEDKLWLADSAEGVRVIEYGPLRAGVEIRRRIGQSAITQRIYVYSDSPRIDFDTTVVWHERHMLLKVAFPVDVLAPRATYDIQFGNIERPTHRNTLWDWGRYEVPAQKWVDLSEGGRGVSLLNDSKYGCDVHDNIMRLTLLRSPSYPDPNTDDGTHRFTYSLLPHQGGWSAKTVRSAYALNNPLWVIRGNGQQAQQLKSFVVADQSHVVIETVKQAENGNGIIVRLYENERKRGAVTLTCARPIQSAARVNLLEQEIPNTSPVIVEHQNVTIHVTPYEIVTLWLLLD